MNVLMLTIVFIYGLAFGSFYNVVIYRLPIDLSISKGRSFCPNCNHSLRAIDLIPVFSYISLKGKCRYCSNKISLRYPLVELINGLLFALAYLLFGTSLQTLFIITFWSYLFIVTMIDIDHKLILDSISLFFFIIFIVLKAIMVKGDILNNFLAGIIAFVVYLLIYLIAKKYYGREAFGLGDVFFIGVVGFCLGLRIAYFTMFFPFIVALVCISIMFLFGKRQSLDMEIPFAPFISLSAFILSIYGNQMFSLVFNI